MTRETYASLISAAQPLVLLLLAALAAWLTPIVDKYVKSKRLATTLETLGRAVDTAVAATSQTFVRDMQNTATPGVWDAGAKLEAKRLALAAVRATMASVLADLPKLGVPNVDSLLDQMLEKAVAYLNARLATGAVAAVALAASLRPVALDPNDIVTPVTIPRPPPMPTAMPDTTRSTR